jgi:hypothetical protein
MAKRQMISQAEAEGLISGSGKPKAKGKKRRTEIQSDADLEGKLTKKVSEHRVERREPEHDSKVGGGALRGVMSESIARVYEEIWPGMNVHQHGDPNDEMKEEAYILSLTMILGNVEDTPRMGLKIREAEISEDMRLCKDCAA